MPELELNGTRIFYEDSERGPVPILFAHGVLWSGRMFEPQVAALQVRYRCVRLDFRGQGRSAVPRAGYDMDSLLGDVVALIDRLDLGPVHFVGLSMGGFVGMRLAARRPDLVRSLVLIGSAAGPESPDNIPAYRFLNFTARWLGLHIVANRVMRVMFGRKFLTDPNRSTLRREMRRRLLSNHRLGATRAVKAVIDRRGVLEEVGRIRCPTLVLVGDQDHANTPDRSRQIQRHIGGALLRIIPGAGHTATMEEPDLININLNDFFESIDGKLAPLPPLPTAQPMADNTPPEVERTAESGGRSPAKPRRPGPGTKKTPARKAGPKRKPTGTKKTSTKKTTARGKKAAAARPKTAAKKAKSRR